LKLTKEQIDWVRKERESLKRLIASEPRKGLIRYAAMEEALDIISSLHNIAIATEREAKQKQQDELKTRIEENKERIKEVLDKYEAK
jgi:glutathione S-transferase